MTKSKKSPPKLHFGHALRLKPSVHHRSKKTYNRRREKNKIKSLLKKVI